MYRVGLSLAEEGQLQDLQQNHIHPHIRRRALVLLLRSENTSNDKILSITGLSENTITIMSNLTKKVALHGLQRLISENQLVAVPFNFDRLLSFPRRRESIFKYGLMIE